MLTGPRAASLTRTFQERIAVIGERAGRITAARWLALGSYDESDIARYAAQIRAAVTAAHGAAVHAGVGYYVTLAQTRPVSVAAREVPVDIDPRDPFISYWNALKHGEPFEAARESGRGRAEAVARNLATSSSRQAGDVSMRKANQRVDGWARNADSGACPWCLDLEQFVWEDAATADFGHDRCNCSVAPVIRAGTVSVEA